MSNIRNRNLIFIIVFLLLTNIGMLVYFTWLKESPARPPHNESHRPGMSDFLQKELGFDKEQLAAFDTLKKKQRTAMKPLFEDLGRSKDSLYQLVGNPSDSAVLAAAAAIGHKQEALELRFFENFRAIRGICNDAQRAKFDSLAPAVIRRMMSPQRKTGLPRKTDSTKTVR